MKTGEEFGFVRYRWSGLAMLRDPIGQYVLFSALSAQAARIPPHEPTKEMIEAGKHGYGATDTWKLMYDRWLYDQQDNGAGGVEGHAKFGKERAPSELQTDGGGKVGTESKLARREPSSAFPMKPGGESGLALSSSSCRTSLPNRLHTAGVESGPAPPSTDPRDAEIRQLRGALRIHAIRPSFGPTDYRCTNCGAAWDGEIETHAPDCLAALAANPQEGK